MPERLIKGDPFKFRVSPTPFVELNKQLNDGLYSEYKNYAMWKRYHLCAIDGSSIRLPNEPDIMSHFGVHNGKETSGRSRNG
ncbi:MAG: hypothetical protein GY941_25525 [Planctomycetes bacterium]|nr:hypothetical protein [Planctomycetota bacterium]